MAADPAGLAALLPVHGARARLTLDHIDGLEVHVFITRTSDGAEAGGITLTAEGNVLTVARLEVSEAARRYGLGSECGALIRALAEAGGFSTLRGWAPPGVGLAVYFWVRMGLRPQFGDGPYGGLWFERHL